MSRKKNNKRRRKAKEGMGGNSIQKIKVDNMDSQVEYKEQFSSN